MDYKFRNPRVKFKKDEQMGAFEILTIYQPIISLNSERIDECIDFTMMCVFFLSVTTFWSMDPVSDRKVNLVGTFKSTKFPIVFKSVRKNLKKVTEKREFLRKTSFR
ncbi:Uncharacterized protein FWK35_00034506 [Aphis craccivora]|uniref:Uncharacterized protein n=1 Tax=Aphis craccivora TaxID=307492 RepID=A0A6G0VYR7_APHCR|nr:Uncharacterized protein FWK35_00034506 [Aphis craccivora]